MVRADPARRGLLYAGTERGVYVSFDDGARWQPLQLNLPIVPVTDLAIKDDDLIAATQGRGFWVARRPGAAAPARHAGRAGRRPPVRARSPPTGCAARASPKPHPRPGREPGRPAPSSSTCLDEAAAGQPVKLEFLTADGKLLKRLRRRAEEGRRERGGTKEGEKAGETGKVAAASTEDVGAKAGAAEPEEPAEEEKSEDEKKKEKKVPVAPASTASSGTCATRTRPTSPAWCCGAATPTARGWCRAATRCG